MQTELADSWYWPGLRIGGEEGDALGVLGAISHRIYYRRMGAFMLLDTRAVLILVVGLGGDLPHWGCLNKRHRETLEYFHRL